MSSLLIPVKIDDVESILDVEFDADFSNIKFDEVDADKLFDTAFLYFRNTGFKFRPDFSNCTSLQIAKVLETYIKTEYDVPNEYLLKIWLKLAFRQIGEDFENDLLTDSQLKNVELLLLPLIEELTTFIVSLNIFCIMLADDSKMIDKNDISRTNYSEFGINLYNILSDSIAEDLLDHVAMSENSIAMKFYNIYFQKDNIKLIEATRNIKLFGIIFEVVKAIENEQ